MQMECGKLRLLAKVVPHTYRQQQRDYLILIRLQRVRRRLFGLQGQHFQQENSNEGQIIKCVKLCAKMKLLSKSKNGH